MINLDPLSASVVLKAIDFLFNQAAKLIEEHKNSDNTSNKEVSSSPSKKGEVVLDKNALFESLTHDINVKEIEHTLGQIDIYTTNTHAFEKQIAFYGGEALAPRELVNKLNISRDALLQQTQKLKQLLETASGKRLSILGLE